MAATVKHTSATPASYTKHSTPGVLKNSRRTRLVHKPSYRWSKRLNAYVKNF